MYRHHIRPLCSQYPKQVILHPEIVAIERMPHGPQGGSFGYTVPWPVQIAEPRAPDGNAIAFGPLQPGLVAGRKKNISVARSSESPYQFPKNNFSASPVDRVVEGI
jgi:hypothetical protein